MTLNSNRKHYYWHTLNTHTIKLSAILPEPHACGKITPPCRNNKRQQLVDRCIQQFGLVFLINNQFDSAEIFLNKSLSEAQIINDIKRVSRAGTNLANVLIKQGKKDQALKLVLFSIRTDSLQKDVKSQGNKLQNTGQYTFIFGQLYSGHKCLSKGNQFLETIQETLSISST